MAIRTLTLCSSVACAFSVATIPYPVEAKIKCKGPYQVVRGVGNIATPYCEDSYLAKVAREFGVRVSARAIRNNPSKKDEVCSLMGFDNRVRDICTGYLSEDSDSGR